MKWVVTRCLIVFLLGGTAASAQEYTNFIRQVQAESGVQRDVSVESTGEQISPLSIDNVGARFELWTVKSSPLASYLLDTKYVGAYVPSAAVEITSEDPYTEIPRTRADRPFFLTINTSGLLSGSEDPEASKAVKLLWHVQSYGSSGTGVDINRDQATLLYQGYLTSNGIWQVTFGVTSIPGSNRAKVRGEERFSIFSLEDYQSPESQLASQFIQIWPVADASISGITGGQVIKGAVPTVSLYLNDLYPDSQTYAQVYPGQPSLGTVGTVVEGSALNINDSVPQSRVLTLSEWDSVFTDDGVWTMEILTTTPFGTDRLAYLTFELDRTIRVKGSVTTSE